MSVKVGDQLDFTPGGKITNLPAPVGAGDAAPKSYVDAAINGLEWKPPVRAMETANRALTGLAAVDGYTPIATDRILLTGQTTTSQNGIWIAAAGAWTRPADFAAASVQQNAAVYVEGGTANAGKTMTIQGTGAVTVDTTAHTWTQSAQIIPITAGTGITVTAGVVALATLKGKAAATITGDGATTAFSVAHTLNTTDVVTQVNDSGGNAVICGVQATDATHVTATFAVAPANGVTYRLIVVG